MSAHLTALQRAPAIGFGRFVISATTPYSSLDTVLGVFSSTGSRLAYNDDIVLYTNTESPLQPDHWERVLWRRDRPQR